MTEVDTGTSLGQTKEGHIRAGSKDEQKPQKPGGTGRALAWIGTSRQPAGKGTLKVEWRAVYWNVGAKQEPALGGLWVAGVTAVVLTRGRT